MSGEPVRCPRCGGLVQRREDQYGVWLTCWMGCWQQDLNMKPLVRRTAGVGYMQGPSLPVTPSNYVPWRERDRKTWMRDETVST